MNVMKVHLLGKKVKSELSKPLLSDSDDDDSTFGDDSDSDDANAEKDVPRDKMTAAAKVKSAAVILVTTAGIASYLAAFMASVAITSAAAVPVIVAGGIGLTTVPMVWVSEWRLTRMSSMRKVINHLRQEAQRFEREVDILVMQVDDLRKEVAILEQSYERLECLVEESGGNVNELVKQVKENQIVLDQMKSITRQEVLQDVVKIVLRSNTDRDDIIITKKGGCILAKRLSLSLEIYGIVLDEEKFYREISQCKSLCRVIALVKRLLPGEDEELPSSSSADSGSGK